MGTTIKYVFFCLFRASIGIALKILCDCSSIMWNYYQGFSLSRSFALLCFFIVLPFYALGWTWIHDHDQQKTMTTTLVLFYATGYFHVLLGLGRTDIKSGGT
jgi:hypothetical protein